MFKFSTFSGTFGRKGSGMGQFRHPWGIACDRTGNVYVADSFNNQIQVFIAEGEFLRMFGRCGRGLGELHNLIASPSMLMTWCMSVKPTIIAYQCLHMRVSS